MTTRVLLATAWLVLLAGSLRADELMRVRSLYASAAYEEALTVLDALGEGEEPVLIDQFRALCSMALGRVTDAELALEAIVRRQPRFDFGEADVSPRLVELYRTVRQRALPAAARAFYAEGRASFEAKQFDKAAAQFKEVVALSDDAAFMKAEGMRDLLELAEGFLTLSAEAQAKESRQLAPTTPAVETAAVPTAPPAAASSPASVAPTSAAPVTYTATDDGVTPPVDIDRRLPPWVPSNPLLRNATFRGVLEIVIDEKGTVTAAQLVTPISPLYDASLLAATSTWRFQPAMKAGQPVRFQKTLTIVLSPPRRP